MTVFTLPSCQVLPQAIADCNWKNKQSLLVSRLDVDEEDEVQNSTNFICIGSLAKDRTFLGAVTCKVTLRQHLQSQQIISISRMTVKGQAHVSGVA